MPFAGCSEEPGLERGFEVVACLTNGEGLTDDRGCFEEGRQPRGVVRIETENEIGIEAVINIGVSIGALPTKGLSLPFISYGGSALMANMIALGLILNISREIPENP